MHILILTRNRQKMSSYDDNFPEEWQCWCNFTNSIRRSKCYLCDSRRKKPNASSKKRSGKDNELGPDTTDNNGGMCNFVLNIRCAHIF